LKAIADKKMRKMKYISVKLDDSDPGFHFSIEYPELLVEISGKDYIRKAMLDLFNTTTDFSKIVTERLSNNVYLNHLDNPRRRVFIPVDLVQTF
jgi:hypothetical protein